MDPFIGEIAVFGISFVPRGWIFCDGRIMQIAENETLFTLLGNRFGGDGITTFGIPDLRSRVALGQSEKHIIGEKGGSESVELAVDQLPEHSHIPASSSADKSNSKDATNAFWSASAENGDRYASPPGAFPMHADSVGVEGKGEPHENRMPVLATVFCIAAYGVFPSQN